MPAQKPKYLTRAMNAALNHLDVASPHFAGSDAVRAALSDPSLRNYLQSWVLPLLADVRDDMPKWRSDSLRSDPAARHWEG